MTRILTSLGLVTLLCLPSACTYTVATAPPPRRVYVAPPPPARRCPPAYYWDGYQCVHKGRGRWHRHGY
ncbi:MAG TPA: hypothetical protein VH877_14740 [Polyangia bacterium]|jgi:hypothetical protein|nr:hypothetical protein [Polyangia bacterium]